MTLDRTGEPVDNCPYECRHGWLTGPYSDEPRPCPDHKRHLFEASPNHSAPISEKARRAIDQENGNA